MNLLYGEYLIVGGIFVVFLVLALILTTLFPRPKEKKTFRISNAPAQTSYPGQFSSEERTEEGTCSECGEPVTIYTDDLVYQGSYGGETMHNSRWYRCTNCGHGWNDAGIEPF